MISKNNYPLNRPRGDEKPSTKGRQLTVTIVSVTDDYITYRLYHNATGEVFHWTRNTLGYVDASKLVVGKSYGINTLNVNGQYAWMSTFPLLSVDKFSLLQAITADTLCDLLSTNQFAVAQDLYFALVVDFRRGVLENQVKRDYVIDFEDVVNYWIERNDYRKNFVSIYPYELTTDVNVEINGGVFDL